MIYCVEDDENIRELVVYTLESTGFQARGFSGGKDLEEALTGEKPELILLDIMLPGEDGITLLKKLRTEFRTREIPVIMVTAKGGEYDKVHALDLGADDYVTKPFGMMELVSRIRAVLRRSRSSAAGTEEELLQAGSLQMDVRKHSVEVQGEEVILTRKEFDLLKKLLMNTEIVLTREQLLEEIWGYDFAGETRTVDVHIRTLRQKLGEAGSLIGTIRGVGYCISGIQEKV